VIGPQLAQQLEKARQHPRLDYYALWSLERVGMGFGLKTINKVDWYAWGSELLLAAQSEDGGWHGQYDGGGCDTSFALLFLNRTNLLSDLTDSLSGRMIDPGEVKLKIGGVGGDSLISRDTASGNILTDQTAGKAKAGGLPKLNLPRGGLDLQDPTPPRPSTGDARLDGEITQLSTDLVRASTEQQEAILEKLRTGKGLAYTEALALAIPQLGGHTKTKAREALAERLARMTAATLRDKLTEGEREIRRAAALACAMKEERSFIPDLIKLLDDTEPLVVRASHAALKALANRDFGPGDDAGRSEIQKAMADWRAWWGQQTDAPADKPTPDTSLEASDHAKLQGNWVVTRIDGVVSATAREAIKQEKLELAFDGDQFTLDLNQGQPLRKATFKLDPMTRIKEIDIIRIDNLTGTKLVVRGIYAWEDGQLKLCLGDVNQERPTTLKAKGSRVVFTLKRKK
jgi:uncharacterized protein (TIGR03067 family)